MRGVPSPVSCDLSPGDRRIWRETTGPANLRSAVGHGALRRVRLRRGAGQRRGGQRPAPVRYRAGGSGPGCPATCGESPHHPRLYGVAPPDRSTLLRACPSRILRESRPRPVGWRAEGAPLKPLVEKVVTGTSLSLLPSVG
jgi:hypothetical protein